MSQKDDYEKLSILVLYINEHINKDFKDAVITSHVLKNNCYKSEITIEVKDNQFNNNYLLLTNKEQAIYLKFSHDELRKIVPTLVSKLVYAHNHQNGTFLFVSNYLKTVLYGLNS